MADQHDPLDSVEPSRRSFIKKMAAAAFVAPVISSFGMETLAAASSKGKPCPPKQSFPNQPPPPPPPPPKCDDKKDEKKDDRRGKRDDDDKGRSKHH